MFRSFSTDMMKLTDETTRRIVEVVKAGADSLISDVESGNPVDSGWSRASWQVSVSGPGTGVYSFGAGRFTPAGQHSPKGNKPPKGAAIPSPASTRKVLKGYKPGDRVFLTNNVPYIGILEGKHGFVKAAVQRAQRRINSAARSMNK